MLNKKSITGLMETIFVLAIIFIILAGGMIFYFNAKKDTIMEEQRKITELNAVEVMQKLISLNELRCSFGNFKSEVCFDKIKLERFNDLSRNDYYFNLFGFSNISVEYFTTNNLDLEIPASIKLYNRGTSKYSSLSYFFTPVIVFDPINNENYYGILNISVYK